MQWLFLVILDKNPSKKTYFHITVTTNHFCFLSYKRRRIFAENYSMYGFFCFPKNEQNIDKIGSFVNKDLILRHKISIEHILFIQTSINQKNVITIQTISDRKYTYRCSLKNIVKQFDCFVYISKSTIININMIVIENMADDFEEMLIAKGFSLRGPFGEHAQFSNGIIISCLPKRKRIKRLIESIETEIVIFKGWGHIDPPSLLETYDPKIEGISSVTTWTLDMDSYNKNVEKFNEFINNYLKNNSSHLEVDFREHQLKRRD